MQYAVKGTDEQWDAIVNKKNLNESGTVQIQTLREKRKLNEDDFDKEAQSEKKTKKTKSGKKKKGRKSV